LAKSAKAVSDTPASLNIETAVAEPPTYFFDTSALCKRYHREPGTDAIDAAFAASAIRIASDLALIELVSTLARRVRMQQITAQDFQAAKAAIMQYTQDQGVLRIEALGEADKADAARLLERYGLHGNCARWMRCTWPSGGG